MSLPADKILYPLSEAQNLLRWSEFFTLEKKKVKENNVISYCVTAPYNESGDAIRIADAMEGALNDVIKNNDSLRMRIIKTGKGLRQYVKDFSPYVCDRIPIDGEEALKKEITGMGKYKVDWLDESLVVAKIFILNEHQAAMLIRIHHAIFDGYSATLFFEQFIDAYNALIAGDMPKEPKKTYSIIDTYKEDEEYMKSADHAADRKYWFRKYNHQRHYSFPAGYRSEFGDCDARDIMLDGELYEKICELAKTCSCSVQAALMTLAALTTYVMTGKDNFCIYSITHGRRKFAAKKTIGCMMNTVPIFYDIDNTDKTVAEYISESYLDFMDALTHARLPMGEQVPMSYKEPIKHFFNFNHGWLMFSTMDYETVKEKTDLEILDIPELNQPYQFYACVLEVPREYVKIILKYQTRKFNEKQVLNILETYKKVCAIVADNANMTIREVFDLVK